MLRRTRCVRCTHAAPGMHRAAANGAPATHASGVAAGLCKERNRRESKCCQADTDIFHVKPQSRRSLAEARSRIILFRRPGRRSRAQLLPNEEMLFQAVKLQVRPEDTKPQCLR